MHGLLAVIIENIATIISIISIAVIVYGTIIASVAITRSELLRFKGRFSTQLLRVIRAELGTYLLLGLELLIASDILKTIVEPSLGELLTLAGIVVLRTILSVFLNKEIREIEAERHEHPDVFKDGTD
ncbi:MAG: DUF1622 domain-containing protein [Spirochaetaceae bacterium]|jgi:uncharacterized membrane protein|nr:DUF1622 domain-containing protein [Spirochaetaceae bacterium]